MAIRKGEEWGEPGTLDPGAPTITDNASLFQLINTPGFLGPGAGATPPMVGLLGGDLARTLGSPGRAERLSSPDAHSARIDLGTISLDGGEPRYFAAHAVVRHRLYRGRLFAVMNAAWIGAWNVAPRSHPGDGRMELVDAHLGLSDKLKARRRLPHGQHVPHPNIAVRRIISESLELLRPIPVHLDGELVGAGQRIDVTVVPEALRIVV